MRRRTSRRTPRNGLARLTFRPDTTARDRRRAFARGLVTAVAAIVAGAGTVLASDPAVGGSEDLQPAASGDVAPAVLPVAAPVDPGVSAAPPQAPGALAAPEEAPREAPGEAPADGAAQRAGVWDRLADCESGRWDRDKRPVPGSARWSYGLAGAEDGFFQGGLQFHPVTWDEFRDADLPDHAGRASREQQIAIAERVLEVQGWEAWPVCSKKLGYR